MNILQWFLGLFSLLNKVKLRVRAEADLRIGKDSGPVLVGSDGLELTTSEQKERAAKRIGRRRNRKGLEND